MKALIVDDDVDLRMLMAELLTQDGVAALVAATGRDALARLLENADTDLVFLDLDMPVENGYQVLAKMRQLPQLAAIRVFLSTGYAVDAAEVMQLPVIGVLAKPFDAQTLLGVVRAFSNSAGASG